MAIAATSCIARSSPISEILTRKAAALPLRSYRQQVAIARSSTRGKLPVLIRSSRTVLPPAHES